MTLFEHLQQIAAIVGGLASLATAVIFLSKPLRDKIFGLHKIADGLECTLRSNMLGTYYANMENETVRQYEMTNLHETYAAYKALGGNLFMDDLYNKMRAWKVID